MQVGCNSRVVAFGDGTGGGVDDGAVVECDDAGAWGCFDAAVGGVAQYAGGGDDDGTGGGVEWDAWRATPYARNPEPASTQRQPALACCSPPARCPLSSHCRRLFGLLA
jgi:hypothetical protein